MKNKIRIGHIEGQSLFRQGIKAILNQWPEFEMVFECEDGISIIQQLKECITLPDVMLIDLPLSPFKQLAYKGLNITRDLIKTFPEIKIIILSANDDEHFISDLIENGAHGYLVKNCKMEELYEAIFSVYNNGTYINEQTLKAIQNNVRKRKNAQNYNMEISKREIEVLQLVCQQLTADEIGKKLFISVKTVNGHRTNLLQKTGSRNVTGLVLYAFKNDMLASF